MSRPSISTAVRVRPPFKPSEDQFCDSAPTSNQLRCGSNIIGVSLADQILGSHINQEVFFFQTVIPKLDLFLHGHDISVIVFGDHFTGKSYTLFGPGLLCTSEVEYGILPRVATYLYFHLESSRRVKTSYQPFKMKMVVFEAIARRVTDLLNPDNNSDDGEVIVERLSQGRLLADGITTRECNSAGDIICLLQLAMSNRSMLKNMTHDTSAIVMLELHQPYIKDGEIKNHVSQAIFVDLACSPSKTYPWAVDINSFGIDQFLLDKLIRTRGGQLEEHDNLSMRLHIMFDVLQDSFNGTRDTLAICCISPSCYNWVKTTVYLTLVQNITAFRAFKLEINKLVNSDDECRMQLQSILISEAESLLSKLSSSGSFSEEDREQHAKWLRLKEELMVISDCGQTQSHGQTLECIEEVTESEEEVLSSSEKMSASNVMATPFCESDQDDCENKLFSLSDADFMDTLVNICVKFSCFVEDSLKDFQVIPVSSPVKERKRACSADRRGALSSVPPMNAVQQNHRLGDMQPKSPENQQEKQKFDLACSSGGANKHQNTEETSDKVKKQPVSREIKKYENPKTIWHHESPIYEKDLVCQFTKEESRIRRVKDVWSSWIMKMSERDQHPEYFKTEKKKEMVQAVEGLSYFMDLIQDIMGMDMDLTSAPNHKDDPFSHRFSNYRKARHFYVTVKRRLEEKVKDKTCSNEELRDYLMCEEMIEAIDASNEYLNNIIIKKEAPIKSSHPSSTEIEKRVADELSELSLIEMRHHISRLFNRVIDLRDSGKNQEATIIELESTLNKIKGKMNMLYASFYEIRGEHERTLQELKRLKSQRHMQMIRCPSPTTQDPLAPSDLALQEGAAGGGPLSIPHQNLHRLQAKPEPPTKVTFTKRKMIIEKEKDTKR